MTNKNNENFVQECYEYMADWALTILENEERREDSLLQQASNMQTVFSFMIAAVFLVAQIMIELNFYQTKIIVVAFSFICTPLFLSLLTATMAQNRKKREDFPSITVLKEKIIKEYEYFATAEQRNKYKLDTYAVIHDSYIKVTEYRRKCVVWSMGFFYVTLFICVLVFFFFMGGSF